MRRISSLVITILALTMSGLAQEERKETPAAKPVLSPTARLQAAKTAFVKNVEGTSIGADTITTTLEGWGRYRIVSTPEKADLIVEITSPSDSEGGVSVSSSSSTASGKYEQSNKSSRELSSGGGPMRMVVRDAKTTATLFVASEQVKGAMKRNTRENNLVDAAQKLVAKFHERVEPVKSSE